MHEFKSMLMFHMCRVLWSWSGHKLASLAFTVPCRVWNSAFSFQDLPVESAKNVAKVVSFTILRPIMVLPS